MLSLLGAAATTNVASGAQPSTRQAQIEADYAAGTADYVTIDGFATALAAFQVTTFSEVSDLQSRIVNTIINAANADQALAAKTLPYALQLLIQQMTANSNTFTANVPAVGAQTAIGTPTGNPTWVYSVLASSGVTNNWIFPDVLTGTITGDAQGTATKGQESWTIVGKPGNASGLSWDFLTSAYGSGATATGNLVDGSSGNLGGLGNLTVNGGLTAYSNSNYPDNFVITVGSAGSTILNGAGTSYLTGSGSVQMVSDGSTLIGIAQAFNTPSTTGTGTGGTPAILQAAVANNAVYCVSVYYKLSVVSPAAGVLRLSVTDSNNVIQQDDNSANLSTTLALTGVGDTNWHQLTLVFRLPKVLPATALRVRVDQSTAVTTGKNVYVSDLAVCQMQQMYAGGPYVTAFSGNTAVNASGQAPDSWTWAVTNTINAWMKLFWRTLNPSGSPVTPAAIAAAQGPPSPYFIPNNGYIIPTAGSGTINDNIVV